MTNGSISFLQEEMQRRSDIFSDTLLYPHDSWKKAVYVLCGVYPDSRKTFAVHIAPSLASSPPIIPLVWRDVAYELLKFTTKQNPIMTCFLPSIENMPVHAIGSSIAVSCSVFSYIQQKETQEKASLLRRWFSKKKRSPLLPLDPPALPAMSLPGEDIRPAWYTANYVAYALSGIYREMSSDGWEQYLTSRSTAYTEETRDENGVVLWKSAT